MRLQILFITFLYLFTGCQEKNSEPQIKIPQELIGKWKAYEVFSTDGASTPTWEILPDKFTFSFEFFENSTVKTDFHGEGCRLGKFTLEEGNVISFIFPCIEHTIMIDSLTNEILILDTQNFEPLKYKLYKLIE